MLPLRAIGLACLMIGSVMGGAAAAPLDAVAVLEPWLLPRYDALVGTTAQQERDWRAFCAAPQAEQVDRLRADFRAVADSWAQVSFISFGPAGTGLRYDRFNFYPDRRQAVARAMADVLDGREDDRLSPGRFTRQSVAVQGLPAMERLLFEADASAALTTGVGAERRCALGLAIALNLATIASDTRSGWGDDTRGLLADLRRRDGPPVELATGERLLSAMLTDLASAYQAVADLNLLAVLGRSMDEVRPLAGEGRLSGREADIVRLQLGSANALARQLAEPLPDPAKAIVLQALAGAQQAADDLPTDLGAAAADPRRRPQLEAAVAAFKIAQRALVDPLAIRLGMPLGFNALDGD